MNELKIFKNENFGQLEVLVKNGKEYFPAIEVAKILGYSNPRKAIIDHCRKEGVTKRDVGVNTGLGVQIVQKKYINEGNLYRLIMKSKLPSAEVFERWVFDEVLPSIRETGIYMTDNVWDSIMKDPEKFGQMIIDFGKTRKENNSLKLINKKQEKEIIEMKPKASYYDLILQNNSLLSTTLIAKDYGMSAFQLNQILKENKIQYKRNDLWILYQKYSKFGYTQSKTNIITRSNGDIESKIHMNWTQKGRKFIYDLLKSKNILPLIEQN